MDETTNETAHKLVNEPLPGQTEIITPPYNDNNTIKNTTSPKKNRLRHLIIPVLGLGVIFIGVILFAVDQLSPTLEQDQPDIDQTSSIPHEIQVDDNNDTWN
ncbi:hypothetical protein FWH13_00040 [Candidatus Saccharibacteria bacterium]|nr:hypothetical protein [Candidatus Saccharibacteria bacterium]